MRFSRRSSSSSSVGQMMFMGYQPRPLETVMVPVTTSSAAGVVAAGVVAEGSAVTRGGGTMVWGQPTWFVLHTLAHKIKDEYFDQLRPSFIELIVRICTNLPCPMCANHASEYLRRINFDAIQTKQDIKDLLFQFHNSVNVRKSMPQLSYAELDAKYDAANTVNIVQNFMATFQQSHNNGAQINVNTFSKNRAITHFNNWFRQNLVFFYP